MLEDSKYNAFVIQTYLKNTPCHLTVAENGADGFKAFKNGTWDIILMDIQMPVMDGYETTRAIRDWERKHNLTPLPIIAMTAYALVGDAEKCFKAGADLHLPKPVKKSALFDVIRDLIGTKQPVVNASETLSDNSKTDTLFVTVRKNITASHTALERGDYGSIKALGSDLADEGIRLSMDAITEYGESLKDAADDTADQARIKHILAVLSEYIDRFETV